MIVKFDNRTMGKIWNIYKNPANLYCHVTCHEIPEHSEMALPSNYSVSSSHQFTRPAINQTTITRL